MLEHDPQTDDSQGEEEEEYGQRGAKRSASSGSKRVKANNLKKRKLSSPAASDSDRQAQDDEDSPPDVPSNQGLLRNVSPGLDGDNGTDDKGRRKIAIEYIEKKEKRHITFSKRKAGIMKKVSPFFHPHFLLLLSRSIFLFRPNYSRSDVTHWY
jgi:hypothetical protein